MEEGVPGKIPAVRLLIRIRKIPGQRGALNGGSCSFMTIKRKVERQLTNVSIYVSINYCVFVQIKKKLCVWGACGLRPIVLRRYGEIAAHGKESSYSGDMGLHFTVV